MNYRKLNEMNKDLEFGLTKIRTGIENDLLLDIEDYEEMEMNLEEDEEIDESKVYLRIKRRKKLSKMFFEFLNLFILLFVSNFSFVINILMIITMI